MLGAVTNGCYYFCGIARAGGDFKAVADTLFQSAKRERPRCDVVRNVATHYAAAAAATAAAAAAGDGHSFGNRRARLVYIRR